MGSLLSGPHSQGCLLVDSWELLDLGWVNCLWAGGQNYPPDPGPECALRPEGGGGEGTSRSALGPGGGAIRGCPVGPTQGRGTPSPSPWCSRSPVTPLEEEVQAQPRPADPLLAHSGRPQHPAAPRGPV